MRRTYSQYLSLVLFAVMACLFVPSCVEDIRPSDADAGRKVTLSFVPRSTVPTKGYVSGTDLVETPYAAVHGGPAYGAETPRTMHVTAWAHVQGSEDTYFMDEAFARNADGAWHADPARYWPFGATMDFMAYSTSVPLSDEQVSWGRGKATDELHIDVDATHMQDDILFSWSGGRTSGNDDGHVDMTFSHAQAWIEVTFRAADAASEGIVTVTRVALEDIYPGGRLNVTHPFGYAEGAWDFRAYRRQAVVLADGASACNVPVTMASRYMGQLIPPQAIRPLVIYYTMAGSDFELQYAASMPVGEWAPGRRYVYEFIFSPHGIEFRPTVAAWDDVTVKTANSAVYGTDAGEADAVDPDFAFREGDRYFWRGTPAEQYIELEVGRGDYGEEVTWQVNGRPVTLRRTATGYEWRRYDTEPFTVVAVESGSVTYNFQSTFPVEVRLNGGSWQTYSTAISVTPGDEVSFRGSNASANLPSAAFSFTGAVDLKGNIMSMVVPEGYGSLSEVPATTFRNYFINASTIRHAKDLVINPPTVGAEAFRQFFRYCTSLLTMPDLPAIRVGENAYRFAFSGCTSLTEVRDLPATVLGPGCYLGMFRDDAELTKMPDILPATVLPENCYYSMFYNCKFLAGIPYMPIPTSLAHNSYDYMFFGATFYESVSESISRFTEIHNLMFAAAKMMSARDTVLHLERCTYIGKEALVNVHSLRTVYFGDALQQFGSENQYDTYNDVLPSFLAEVVVPNTNTKFKVIDNIIYSKDGTICYGAASLYLSSTSETVIIPEGVTKIYPGALRSLLDVYAYDDPSYYEWVSSSPQPGYHKLRHIIFPSTLEFIGDRVMQIIQGVEDVTILATTPPEMPHPTCFSARIESFRIYVPAGSVDAYKAAPNWSDLADIIEPIP